MYLNENDFFRHQDICLIATLCSYGYAVDAIDKQNPKKVVFIVKRDEKIDEITQQYWTNELLVEPKAFFNYLKELKTRIYNG
ncbi:hypothetical protein GYA54_02210 [Candidatus Kuenenbacteria bacterium]|nr:hypothetical protein [Candidatus Kuenenbacteria bacterium]